MQTITNVMQMEDMDLATKPAQIQLGHSFAAVRLVISYQDSIALVRSWLCYHLYYSYVRLFDDGIIKCFVVFFGMKIRSNQLLYKKFNV